MCGRHSLISRRDLLEALFQTELLFELQQSFNIAPSQPMALVRSSESGDREWAMLQWGLVPSWADLKKLKARPINARSEEAASKPFFRHAMRKKRCLIPTDGFYEWARVDARTKQPFYIRMKDEKPFAFAGIWEYWEKEGETIESCAILTTSPNDLCKKIHNRMPVILSPDHYDLWLDHENEDPKTLHELFDPFPEEGMEAYPVSTYVNSPRNNDAGCVERVGGKV